MRRIVQISVLAEHDQMYGSIVALADDGTLWRRRLWETGDEWMLLKNIPQTPLSEMPDHPEKENYRVWCSTRYLSTDWWRSLGLSCDSV